MKLVYYSLIAVLSSVTAGARTWTDVRGREVDAEIVSVSTGSKTVTLKSDSGKQHTVPVRQLSEADKEYLKSYLRYLEPPPVTLDISQIPELEPWGNEAVRIIEEWYPKIAEILYSENCVPQKRISLQINNPGEGVAAAAGNRIFVAASWIEKEPGHGVVIHELTHVVQAYRGGGVGWLVEGVADYIRWGLYEEKPLEWFPVPRNPDQDYRQSYRVAAGFLFWLETERAPGLVRKLNAAMREKRYSDDLFKKETGTALDGLWMEYKAAREKKA